jgi:hypothetical protein
VVGGWEIPALHSAASDQPVAVTPDCTSAADFQLPVHASWLNQVEVYFSVIQRKLLTADDFEGLDELADQILAFEKHYNAAARPFDWRFNRADLNRRLARVRHHDRHAPRPQAA